VSGTMGCLPTVFHVPVTTLSGWSKGFDIDASRPEFVAIRVGMK
jgi:hypothetical protein